MAPASAKSMAMANANAQTADMNRIEDNPRRMGNYESGLAAVVKAAIRTSRTSLIDPLHFRSNGYPDRLFSRRTEPFPVPPTQPHGRQDGRFSRGQPQAASFIEVFEYRDLGGRKAPGRVR